MAYYRVHLVKHDTQLVGTKYFVCDADEDALNRAKAIVTNELGAEVWDGARLIGVIPRGATPERRSAPTRVRFVS